MRRNRQAIESVMKLYDEEGEAMRCDSMRLNATQCDPTGEIRNGWILYRVVTLFAGSAPVGPVAEVDGRVDWGQFARPGGWGCLRCRVVAAREEQCSGTARCSVSELAGARA